MKILIKNSEIQKCVIFPDNLPKNFQNLKEFLLKREEYQNIIQNFEDFCFSVNGVNKSDNDLIQDRVIIEINSLCRGGKVNL